MPGVALQDIHTLLAQDTARVHRESSNATESLLRVLDDPPPPSKQPPPFSHQHPHHSHFNQHHNPNMPTAASPNGTPAKSRLTEAEKKLNHINSEKKRRDAIRAGFDKLSEIVPKMSGQGRSEAIVLQHTVLFMKKLIAERETLDQIAADKGWTPKERNDVYTAAEEEIRRKDDALEIAAQQAHQAAQQAVSRQNQMAQR